MILFLRVLFVIVLLSMVAVTGWASLQVPLWKIPGEVGGHPWFIATLFDTYWAFLTFYCWVCYRETGVIPRVLWLIAILGLGNIAMAIYMLNRLFRIPQNATARDLLLRPEAS